MILICDERNYLHKIGCLQTSNNGAIDRILEDPFFKQSDQSYFIQLSDFVLMRCFVKNVRLSPKRDTGLTKHSIC